MSEIEQPEIDMVYADVAFLETAGTDATRVKAAIWAWLNLRDDGVTYLSLNQIREWLQSQGFTVVNRG